MQQQSAPAQDRTRMSPAARWALRSALALLLLALLIFLIHWWWSGNAEKRLASLMDQYRSRGEPVTPEDLNTAPIPDAENAVLDLRAASRSIDTTTDLWSQCDKSELDLPLTDKELALIDSLLQANAQALSLIRQATTKPGVDWQLTFSTPVVLTLLSHLNDARTLANLLRPAALHAHSTGNDREALQHVGDIIFIADAVDRQPFLISHLVAVGIRAMAVDLLAQLAPQLTIDPVARDARAPTPDQLRSIIADLLNDQPLIEGQRTALLSERLAQMDLALALAGGRSNPNQIGTFGLQNAQALTAGGRVFKPLILADARIVAEHITAMIDAIQQSPSWPAFRQAIPDRPAAVEQYPRLHIFASLMLPALKPTGERHYRILTEQRLVATALAIRWYAVEHEGAYPQTLQDLIPRYLPTIPTDPYTPDNQPLKYSPDPQRPIVYSAGLNEIDDGGSDKLKRPSARPNRWNMDDAILHLTRQPRWNTPDEDDDHEPPDHALDP